MPRFCRALLMLAVCLTSMVGFFHATSESASARPKDCDYKVSYTYKYIGKEWAAADRGRISNKSKATVKKSIEHTFNFSASTTVSGEIGLSAKAGVANINAKLGLSVTLQAGFTTRTSFEITVPPKTTVRYEDGILFRNVRVYKKTIWDNCATKTVVGTIKAVDAYSRVY